MPWASVTLQPGVNVERTPTLNVAGYSESQLIRFRGGLAEKIGGWTQYYGFAVGGVPRAMHAWQDVNEGQHLAVGSTTALGIITGGALTNISPQTLVTDGTVDVSTTNTSTSVTIVDANIANITDYDSVEFRTPVSVGGIILSGVYPIDAFLSTTSYRIIAQAAATATVANGGAVPVFDSTSGSQTVDVTFEDHGLAVGDVFVAPISTTVGGVTILGAYTVTAVADADTFSIAVDELASSTATVSMNSGDAELKYYIALGPAAAGGSYGTGTYGSGGYGTGTAVSAQVGSDIGGDDWTFDNWGSTLISVPDGGGVYRWTPDTGFQNAQLVPTAPPFNGGAFITAPAQILLCWASSEYHEIGVDQDPLFYRWSDSLDYEFWTPGVTNPATGDLSQAGFARIPTGSRIVAGMQSTQQALLWTDLDLWAINYLGQPSVGLIFGQTPIGRNCGAIGKHAVGQLGSTVFWMGQNNFFAFSGGGVQALPCPVWDVVFQDIDRTNAYKVRAAPNTPFNEMWWFFPSASGGTGENDSYVKVNVLDGAWDYGRLGRSAWIDQSVLGNPIGAEPTGLIQQHETARDAAGQPILWSFTTGYWSIGEGEDVAFIDEIIPDFKFGTFGGVAGATIEITIYTTMFPNGPVKTYGPYTVTAAKTKLNVRIRGRQMSMKISGSDLGSFARLGRVRYQWAPDGRY